MCNLAIPFGTMVAVSFLHMKPIHPAGTAPRPSRRAMFDTLLRHLSMVRLTATSMGALVAMSTLSACLGEVVTKDPGGETKVTAKDKFLTVALPKLNEGSCTSCHTGDPNYPFFAGADDEAKYATIIASSVVNFEAPESSRLLTKGLHSGQPLTTEQSTAVLEWLTAERDERSGTGQPTLLETPEFTPLKCTAGVAGDPTCPLNTVALDAIGAPGAKITFVYEQPTSTLTYLSDITLSAGAGGVFIEHPLFASIDPGTGKVTPDDVDQFFSTKENLQTGSVQLRGGTATFHFAPNAKMKLLFKAVKPYQADQGGGTQTGGCKKVPEFIAMAKPMLAASCTGGACHQIAGNNANSALALTGIAGNDMTELTNACNQTLTRVNKQDVNNSAIFLAPRVGGNGHPFRFANQGAADAFANPIKNWIQQEITAP